MNMGLFYGSSTCYTEMEAEKIRDILGVTGAGTVKKTHIHNVSFSILLWLLRLVYQNREAYVMNMGL
ncbi:hypothetical protein QJN78_24655, partial [Escherichia coli]